MKFTGKRSIDILLKEARYYSYNVPSSLNEKIVDFYLLNRYSKEYIADEELSTSLNDAIGKILPGLKEYFLDQLYNAITGEAAIFTYIYKKDGDLYRKIKEVLKGKDEYSYEGVREIGREYFSQFSREEIMYKLEGTLALGGKNSSVERVYQQACSAWLLLNKADSIDNISIAIDHVIDLEHNAGTIFERFPLVGKEELAEIKNLLHTKSLESTESWTLYERASSSLKPMIASIIKQESGKGYDLYTPKEFSIADKKKSIHYIEGLLNFLSYKANELSDKLDSEDFLFSIDKFIQNILDNPKYEKYNLISYYDSENKTVEYLDPRFDLD